jgi:DNA-binding transcriptional MocR family regulator
MYLTEAEYQLIMGKAKSIDISASKFTKQAVATYIKHLDKHLQDAEPIAA